MTISLNKLKRTQRFRSIPIPQGMSRVEWEGAAATYQLAADRFSSEKHNVEVAVRQLRALSATISKAYLQRIFTPSKGAAAVGSVISQQRG